MVMDNQMSQAPECARSQGQGDQERVPAVHACSPQRGSDSVDADGDLDVISTAPGESGGSNPRVAWYQRPTDPVADTWTKVRIGDLTSATRVVLADLNADGRSDVVSSMSPMLTLTSRRARTSP